MDIVDTLRFDHGPVYPLYVMWSNQQLYTNRSSLCDASANRIRRGLDADSKPDWACDGPTLRMEICAEELTFVVFYKEPTGAAKNVCTLPRYGRQSSVMQSVEGRS